MVGGVEETEDVVEEVVFTRENRGGSAQRVTRATSIRSSHGPMEEDEEEEVFFPQAN